jgi:hypothetical protein
VLSPGRPASISGRRSDPRTETQDDRILKELRIIKVCVVILTVIIAIAFAKATFNL